MNELEEIEQHDYEYLKSYFNNPKVDSALFLDSINREEKHLKSLQDDVERSKARIRGKKRAFAEFKKLRRSKN